MVRMFSALAIALILLSVAVAPTFADEKKVGLGVDLENQHLDGTLSSVGTAFRTMSHSSLTPFFVLSIRANPNLFIEPGIGIYSYSEEETDNSVTPSTTDTNNYKDLKFGIGVLYMTSPSSTVSPFVRGNFAVHKLEETEENPVQQPTVGTDKIEKTATAYVISGSLGGIVTIKNNFFITVEGRLAYGWIGDVDDKRSGPNYPTWQDQEDSKSTVLTTDMVIGLRVLFF